MLILSSLLLRRPALLLRARGLWRSLALTLRWAGSAPLLRRGWTLQRACPYYAGPPRSTACLSHLGTRPCQRLATFALGTWSPCVGPYSALGRVLATFAPGRVLATFAPGLDPVVGRPLLRGAATLNGSSIPLGHETVSETSHFCAGHMISVCLALTSRWAESSPLLRRGWTLQRAGPY